MCGICGMCISDAGALVSQPVIRKMTDVLAHRGPDGCGFLFKGNIGFGHRRLSIIDIEGGDQPIYSEDGRIGVVFNGEIYNYRELMTDLTSRGHQLSTRSDTEVIIHLYEEYSERCVEHLRGMFAFAIWDGRDGSVLLARDRLGIKPLFYHADSERLLFGSELKSIVQDRSVRRALDIDVLGEYLVYGYVPGDRCILHGVSKLPPGHTLRWHDGIIRIEKYWGVSFQVSPPLALDDCAEALSATLQETVALHLRSDVPIGILLSGGIDSATMVALASAELSSPVKTFSVGFAEQDFDELALARQTARRYHTDHNEIIVRDRDTSILESLAWHLDEPFADPSAVPTYYVCREAARHVKVCLTGDGGDELFGGYGRYRNALSYRYVDWIPAPLRRIVFSSLSGAMPRAMWGKGLLARAGANGARRYLDSVGVFPLSEALRLLKGNVLPSHERLTRYLDPFFGNDGRDVITSLQLADQKTYLPDDILVKVDRMSMQNSLEIRPPFLDHKIVDFANCCPVELKVRSGQGKVILKHIMRERIPTSVIQGKKRGFGLPIKHWFRGELKSTARDMLLEPSARSATFLKRAEVERVISDHQHGMRDLSRRIWSLLVLEQWCRVFEV